ncbi:uncharacterized protein LY79DRAFT_571246 [Colletotrichum navitas]|uniref:Uncharacterized protein n=1 Tax=Colletotrichum navitas TaxID=681940 RepID=A0AAD8PLJ8_9PEZI|nr:uncharacterized protein LY79DRAFT_571246 [Colletotrichum navitas]KAK1569796.1 hypothetical protein LY79DRAFT_571246 [Colletotrichum navitas]
MVPNPDIFFISGVSLPVPPWPENPILSAAILLHPGNVKRFGRSLEFKNVRDRQRRIYTNLVVLFRLVTRCCHLAFDHDAFWSFVTHHWGVPNAGPRKVEELVDIYSERRRVYSAAAYIKRKHRDILTDLIDAWNSRDSSSSMPSPLSGPEIAAEWERVKTSWLEQLRLDHQSLFDESSLPFIGAFPARKGTPFAFQIKGGSSRALASGKDLFERITAPSPGHHCMSSVTANDHTVESPAPKATEDIIGDFIQTESRKRRFTSDTPNTAKRQCIPESPLSCLQLENEAVLARHKADAQEEDRNSSDHMSLDASYGPADDAIHRRMEAQQTEQSLTLGDPTTSCIGLHVGINNGPSSVSSDKRMKESNKEMQMLKEQTKLLLESRELSRDLQKAHDQLIMFTASKCQESLERLDQLSNQVDILGKDVVACRQSGEELQKRQTKQQNLIHGLQDHVACVESALEEAKKDMVAHESRRNHDEHHKQVVEARLFQLESKLESQTSARLQTTESVEAELQTLGKGEASSLEAVVPERLDEHHETSGMIRSSHPLNLEFEGRLTNMEETIATSTALINHCRTLVGVSKTTVDQHFQILDNRVKMLENWCSNHIADQTRISKEQTRRLELVEAELTRYKEAASNQLQQMPGRPSWSEFADLQAQLNVMQNSLAAIEQTRANPTGDDSGTPLSLISQTALHRPVRSEQNVPSASSRKHVPNIVAVKKEN